MPGNASAHVDTFTRDHLPAPELWPVLDLAAAGLNYGPRVNATVELLNWPLRWPASVRCSLMT